MPRTPPSPRPSFVRRVIYSLVPVALVFGSAETALRMMGWPTAEAAFEHNEPFWQVDPDLDGFAMSHREEGATFPVSTNADGLRPPHHDRAKPSGVQRVMTLGCSTTFGWGVQDNETYPARLEALAHENGHAQVEVINGGQPGYTSFQGSWLWDRVLRHYTPDVVLIGYVVQDARKAAYSDKSQAILQGDARFLKDNVLYRLKTYLGLRSLLGGVEVRAKERSGDQGGVFRVPPEDYVENLRALVKGVQAADGVPVLFGYPLEREGYTRQHRVILRAAADELGVPWFDPQAGMEAATRQQQMYFSRDRGHANSAGNDWIAREALGFLERENLLTTDGG